MWKISHHFIHFEKPSLIGWNVFDFQELHNRIYYSYFAHAHWSIKNSFIHSYVHTFPFIRIELFYAYYWPHVSNFKSKMDFSYIFDQIFDYCNIIFVGIAFLVCWYIHLIINDESSKSFPGRLVRSELFIFETCVYYNCYVVFGIRLNFMESSLLSSSFFFVSLPAVTIHTRLSPESCYKICEGKLKHLGLFDEDNFRFCHEIAACKLQFYDII